MGSDIVQEQKRRAALKAVEFVECGMIVGLGSGSTMGFALEEIGRRVKQGLQIKGIPTSNATEEIAASLQIPLTTLEENPIVNLTIDGADEIDADFDAIKGRGGALLREKIVAWSSQMVVVIVDSSKMARRLGGVPVPVEVVPFGWAPVRKHLTSHGVKVTLRASGENPYITDNGNYILDCDCSNIDDIKQLDEFVRCVPAVVDTGLFLNLIDTVVVGDEDGVYVNSKR